MGDRKEQTALGNEERDEIWEEEKVFVSLQVICKVFS